MIVIMMEENNDIFLAGGNAFSVLGLTNTQKIFHNIWFGAIHLEYVRILGPMYAFRVTVAGRWVCCREFF